MITDIKVSDFSARNTSSYLCHKSKNEIFDVGYVAVY